MIGVYGLLPSPASAAEIAKIATGAVGAAGVSATLGTSTLKTITIMTTKQLAAIGAVVCAIATVTIVQLTKEKPSGDLPVATAPPPVRPAPVVKKTAKPVDWNRIDPQGKLSALAAFAGDAVPSPPELQALSTEELLAALDEVTNQDGISKNTKIARRGAIIKILAERDPMLVLNRLEEDEPRDFWLDLLPAYEALAKKDFNAADQWLKQQLDKGLLAEKRNNESDESFERNCFESSLLKELQKTDPDAVFQRVLARENGSDRSQLLLDLHSGNFPGALSQSLDHYRSSGDSLLFQDLMNTPTLEFTFSPSLPIPAQTKEQIQQLVNSMPDEAVRNAALKRIEAAKHAEFQGVPAHLLQQ